MKTLLYFFVGFAAYISLKKNTHELPQVDGEMVILKGPIHFVMGSPESEQYRTTDEIQHMVIIPRSFAISKKEVTIVQFQKFLEANPEIKKNYSPYCLGRNTGI